MPGPTLTQTHPPSRLIIWHRSFVQLHSYQSVTFRLPHPLILLIPIHVYEPVLNECRMQIAPPLAFVRGDACMINNIALRSI